MALTADGSVHVVRGGNVGGVQVLPFLVEQNAPVLIDLRSRKQLQGLGRPSEVNVANRDDLNSRAFSDLGQVSERHARGAKTGVAQRAAWAIAPSGRA